MKSIKKLKIKYLLIILTIILILLFGIFQLIFKSIDIYKNYGDFPNGIIAVTENDIVRFYQYQYQYINTEGAGLEVINVNYEQEIIYYRIIFYYEVTLWDEFFNKGTAHGADAITTDGVRVGADDYTQKMYNPITNKDYECHKRYAEVYYKNKDGSLILLWKADFDYEKN